jgi:glutathionylspermidine synthase
MKRMTTTARAEWEKRVEEQGLIFHTTDEGRYWHEGVYYEFTAAQIDVLEAATNELHEMCLDAVQHVIDRRRYAELHIPEVAIPMIERSWEEEWPSIYGRFDLAFDGSGQPKMLEYNADTPTSLLEASVIQWTWMEDRFPHLDQFNSMHDKLIAWWKEILPYMKGDHLYFTSMDDREDFMTSTYLADTAHQAGIPTEYIVATDIGYDSATGAFVDLNERNMRNVFKLYPWEWVIDQFGAQVVGSLAARRTTWIEPLWKMVLSNKGILPILWDLNPGHPNLLPTYFEQEASPDFLAWDHVRKPLLSREGANVEIRRGAVAGGGVIEARGGEYGEEGFVVQELTELPGFEGSYPVIGSWVIGGEAAGIGIRETDHLITDNFSRFVPHVFTS